MDGFDDDFGDLYADVEVQANSAIIGLPDFAKLYAERRQNEEQICDSTRKVDSSRRVEKMLVSEGNGSDSEDDLNIVLNEGDSEVVTQVNSLCKNLELSSNGCGGERGKGIGSNMHGAEKGKGESSGGYGYERGNVVTYRSQYPQYKYIRCHGAAFPSNINADPSIGAACFSSMLARGDREDNVCNPRKVSSSGQIVHNNATATVAQSGYGFFLPWFRTILDVNIDTFEEKPWMYPGVDITDFFNFGLSEESWKDYCKSLELYRQQTSMQTRIPEHGSSKLNQLSNI